MKKLVFLINLDYMVNEQGDMLNKYLCESIKRKWSVM